MFERFVEWERNRHDYARQWKERTGGKVLGYFCTYVPEEILVRRRRPAGAHPGQPRAAGRHRAAHLRHVLSVLPRLPGPGAQGPLRLPRRDHDRPVLPAHPAGLHELGEARSHEVLSYYLPMPHDVQSRGTPLHTLRASWRPSSGRSRSGPARQITDDGSATAIEVYNANRQHLRRRSTTLRKADRPA